jgi:hypothetical protein
MAVQGLYVYGQSTTPYTYVYHITYANIPLNLKLGRGLDYA